MLRAFSSGVNGGFLQIHARTAGAELMALLGTSAPLLATPADRISAFSRASMTGRQHLGVNPP
jgi:hypothetical protein